MIESKAFGSAFPNQYPFVSDTGPIVEYLVPLNEFRTVRQHLGCGRLQTLGQTFFPHYVDQADTTGPEAREDVAKNLYDLGFLVGVNVNVYDDLVDALQSPAVPDWKQGRNNLVILYALTADHPERAQFEALRGQVDDSLHA